MSLGGSGQGGVSTSGTTKVFQSLPYRGYRELDPWFEEFINAIAAEMEILEQRFITSTARANMLDPTHTPTESTENQLATSTAAPLRALSQDSMIDILAYLALAIYPLNQNFSTAEKQGMVSTGGNLQRRKGTRQALLKTAAQAAASVLTGWTVPPFNFSIILPDGLASPGWGSWSPTSTQQAGTVATTNGNPTVTGTGTAFPTDGRWTGYRLAIVNGSTVLTDWVLSVASATSLTTVDNLGATTTGSTLYISPGGVFRPWIFDALRQVLGRFFPDWSEFGIAYSQFRGGYSAAEEVVLPSGAAIGRLANPHFDTWSAGTPSSWTKTGSGTLTQSPSVAEINYEFTSSAAQIDLTGAAAGVGLTLSQSATVNNQLQHRVEVDYAYTNAELVNVLTLQILDTTNTKYWNGSGWQADAYSIALPVSTGSAVRVRHAENVTLQASTATSVDVGTGAIKVSISATSDGTTSTKIVYTIYRCDVLPMYSSTIEAAAGGERTLWLPLVDQLGLSLKLGNDISFDVPEPANADRSAFKFPGSADGSFPYHAAISGRGFQARTDWTSQVRGSNDFGADWTLTNATRTANSDISPAIGEVSPSAVRLTATSTGANIVQTAGDGISNINPASTTYVGGVWVKKISTDGNFTDVTISLISSNTYATAFTLKQSQGWQLLPVRQTFTSGDTAALKMKIAWGAASSTGAIAVTSAYLYAANGPDILYPPVAQSPIGSRGNTEKRGVKAITATQDSDVLDPNLRRSMVSVTRGVAQFTIVPVYGAASQPNCVIFDFGESTTKNRIYLSVASGVLTLKAIDNASTATTTTLTLTAKSDPSSTQVTWLRDQAITIRIRWQDTGALSLSANASSSTSAAVGGWTPIETGVAKIRVGCDIADTNNFDGIVQGVEVLQVGGPVT